MKPRHPARRKIHHPYNQLVNQILAAIQDRQLRARLFNTNLWAEINAQLIRWFARLWEWLSRNNASNAHLYPLKVLKGHDWQRHQPTSSLFSRFTCFFVLSTRQHLFRSEPVAYPTVARRIERMRETLSA